MKKYKKQICLTAAVCLLGAAAFCGYHIYDHYAHEAEQTEAFEEIAAIVEQAQTEDSNAPEVPLTEEENVLAEYGELFLKNTDRTLEGGQSVQSTESPSSFLFEVRSAKCGKLKNLHIRLLWLKLLQCIWSTAEVGATQRRLYLW